MSKNLAAEEVLAELFCKIDSKESLSELLTMLLTRDEADDIVKRLDILTGLISAKQSQRDLAQSLKVSIAKITRASNLLKNITPQQRENLIKLLQLDN